MSTVLSKAATADNIKFRNRKHAERRIKFRNREHTQRERKFRNCERALRESANPARGGAPATGAMPTLPQ